VTSTQSINYKLSQNGPSHRIKSHAYDRLKNAVFQLFKIFHNRNDKPESVVHCNPGVSSLYALAWTDTKVYRMRIPPGPDPSINSLSHNKTTILLDISLDSALIYWRADEPVPLVDTDSIWSAFNKKIMFRRFFSCSVRQY
jgi:hypothetical protein